MISIGGRPPIPSAVHLHNNDDNINANDNDKNNNDNDNDSDSGDNDKMITKGWRPSIPGAMHDRHS